MSKSKDKALTEVLKVFGFDPSIWLNGYAQTVDDSRKAEMLTSLTDALCFVDSAIFTDIKAIIDMDYISRVNDGLLDIESFISHIAMTTNHVNFVKMRDLIEMEYNKRIQSGEMDLDKVDEEILSMSVVGNNNIQISAGGNVRVNTDSVDMGDNNG